MTVWCFGCQTTQHNKLKFGDKSRGSGSLVFRQTVCPFPVPVEHTLQILGFGENSLHESTSMEPRSSKPALHLPFADREASICCTIHSPLGVVIHVKGSQRSMSDIFFMFNRDRADDFRLLVLSGNSANQSVSAQVKLDHFTVYVKTKSSSCVA